MTALRRLTLFEYGSIAALIAVVASWRSSSETFATATYPALHLGLLQFVAVMAATAYGGRTLFRRDQFFDMWQVFVFLGVSFVPLVAIMGGHALATEHHWRPGASLAWLAPGIAAMMFAIPDLGHHASLRYRRKQRVLRLLPVLAACLVAAAITAYAIHRPSVDPRQSPYAPWFPAEGR